LGKEIQRAQDMLNAMQGQRDTALNAIVHAQAEIAALNRALAEKDKMIADRDETLANLGRIPVKSPEPSPIGQDLLHSGDV
jgi:hypothetical protein